MDQQWRLKATILIGSESANYKEILSLRPAVDVTIATLTVVSYYKLNDAQLYLQIRSYLDFVDDIPISSDTKFSIEIGQEKRYNENFWFYVKIDDRIRFETFAAAQEPQASFDDSFTGLSLYSSYEEPNSDAIIYDIVAENYHLRENIQAAETMIVPARNNSIKITKKVANFKLGVEWKIMAQIYIKNNTRSDVTQILTVVPLKDDNCQFYSGLYLPPSSFSVNSTLYTINCVNGEMIEEIIPVPNYETIFSVEFGSMRHENSSVYSYIKKGILFMIS